MTLNLNKKTPKTNSPIGGRGANIMKITTLNIPAKPHVKSYFEHELVLGPECRINKRHMVGEMISLVLSFGATKPAQLPVEWRLPNADLGHLRLRVEFDIDGALITPHHLAAIGYTLEKWWEQALLSFVLGYFEQSPGLPWKAAVVAFTEKYNIDTTTHDADYIRRYMHLKYNTTLRHLYKKEETAHLKAIVGVG